MGQLKSMLKSAVCGPGNQQGSQHNSDAEDSDAETPYGNYQPLRDLRDGRDVGRLSDGVIQFVPDPQIGPPCNRHSTSVSSLHRHRSFLHNHNHHSGFKVR